MSSRRAKRRCQGTSEAVGIALALDKKGSDVYTYLFVGDGELNEGQCWESFQFAAANKLHNLIVFIDDNKRQLDGWTKDVMNPFDIAEKMRAFGFNTQKVDGQDIVAVDAAITEAKQNKKSANCIVLDCATDLEAVARQPDVLCSVRNGRTVFTRKPAAYMTRMDGFADNMSQQPSP